MNANRIGITIIFALGIILTACTSQPNRREVELRSFALDNTETIISQTDVTFDKAVTSDGNGSLRIDAAAPMHIRLLELNDVDIEQATLFYRAAMRAENFIGNAYLEMWCGFNELGEYFSRDLQSTIDGSTDWRVKQTPFVLQKGQNPDRIKLNLVVNGTGTVWIDDIHLVSTALP